MPAENSQGTEWTIHALLHWSDRYFADHRIDSPRLTAELLLAHALGLRRLDLYLRYDQPLNAAELARFKALILRRRNHEPVAYIIGRREFYSLEFAVEPDVLIPRPETELLIEVASEAIGKDPSGRRRRSLELGTGSGAIVVTLAVGHPETQWIATDASPAALRVARRNAAQHAVADRIAFLAGCWFAPLQVGVHPFDLIVSNPPYVRRDELAVLMPEVRRYEPRIALDGGDDGLRAIAAIVQGAGPFLRPGGSLILEIGHDQAAAVSRLASGAGGFQAAEVHQDLAGRDRVVHLRRNA